MHIPDRPEHHYYYDPAKSDAYIATTLAWLGDSAAETALDAVTSGRLVRSHYWRLAEVTIGIAERDSAGAARVRDAFRDIYGQ